MKNKKILAVILSAAVFAGSCNTDAIALAKEADNIEARGRTGTEAEGDTVSGYETFETNIDESETRESDTTKNEAETEESNISETSEIGTQTEESESTEAQTKESGTAENESEEITATESESISEEITDVENSDGEGTSGESISEEITSEESASEESTSEEITSEPGIIKGNAVADFFDEMPDDFRLSGLEMSYKRGIAEHLSDITVLEAGTDYVDGQVVFEASDEDEARAVAEALHGTLISYDEYVAVAELDTRTDVMSAVAYSSDLNVNIPALRPNYIWHAFGETDEDTAAEEYMTIDAIKKPSNDASLSYQWQHDFVGDSYAWFSGYKGSGIKVGILDSGVLGTHEDLSANLVSSTNYNRDTSKTSDENGHGTHVAGIIGARANNGKGGAGIAPEVRLYSYKVLDSKGNGKTAYILRALNAAVGYSDGKIENPQVDIVNMSLGGPGYDPAFDKVIDLASKTGIMVFVAAGNERTDTLVYPAYVRSAYTIVSLTKGGGLSSFSNYGPHVDFAFPGSDIYSTSFKSGSGYEYMSGTSMACPVAAGVAAVIMSYYSENGKSGLARANAVAAAMKKGAVRVDSSGTGLGYTYIPKALGLGTMEGAPAQPCFDKKSGTYYQDSIEVNISSNDKYYDYIKIYYSTDGKAPVFKNGILSENACSYGSSAVCLSGSRNVTLSAIAINLLTGMVSKPMTVKYSLAPVASKVKITSSGQPNNLLAGRSLSLKADIYPEYAFSNKVKWSVSPENQGVTVSNGTVRSTANAKPGKYVITAQAIGADLKNYTGAKGAITVNVVTGTKVKDVRLSKKRESVASGKTVNVADDCKVTYVDGSIGNNSDLVWSSSNSKAATVNNKGMVTGVAPGKTIITAAANDGSGKKASITVDVTRLATDIKLSGYGRVTAGKSVQLKAEIFPVDVTNKKLIWSVTPENGVKISSNGKLTASKSAYGKYTVRAQAADGSGISDTFSVNVISGTITGITIPKNQKNITLFNSVGKKSERLVPSITGTGAYSSSDIIYTSSNPGIASVDQNGNITAIRPGKTVITCRSTDGSAKSATCSVSVNIPASSITIAPVNGMTEYVAVGAKVRYAARLSADYGKPTNKKVIWSSSNTQVAVVDKNGNVKGISEGKTVITAEAADGSGVKGRYTVNVIPRATSLKLSLNQKYGVLYVSSDTSCKYFEMTGPKNVGLARADYDAWALAYATKPGTYTFKVKILDGSNKTAVYKLKIRTR